MVEKMVEMTVGTMAELKAHSWVEWLAGKMVGMKAEKMVERMERRLSIKSCLTIFCLRAGYP